MEDSCEVYMAIAEGSEAGWGERTVPVKVWEMLQGLWRSLLAMWVGRGSLNRRVTAFDLDLQSVAMVGGEAQELWVQLLLRGQGHQCQHESPQLGKAKPALSGQGLPRIRRRSCSGLVGTSESRAQKCL